MDPLPSRSINFTETIDTDDGATTEAMFKEREEIRKAKEEKADDDECIRLAIERYRLCEDGYQEIWREARTDLDFVAGKQWPETLEKDRLTSEGGARPVLTINKLLAYTNKVCNDYRMNRPQLRVIPGDNQADSDTADVIEGLMRHIQIKSDGEATFDAALDYAAICGFGYMRVRTDWAEGDTFKQEIKLERVDDPFSVLFPTHLIHTVDYADAPYCFVVSHVAKDEFVAQHPQWGGSDWPTSGPEGWLTDKTVRIVEYFVIEETPRTIYQMADGTIASSIVEGQIAVDSREVIDRKVKWYKMSCFDILERGEFPGSCIPIVPALGRELMVNGRKMYISLIRNGRDPQRTYNYFWSSEAERVALAPKSPFILAEGQDEGHEREWQLANRANLPYLRYKPTSIEGQLVPAPQRQMPVQVDSGIVELLRESNDNIKSAIGLFDASMGNAGPEKSGKAIQARQREGDLSNLHFVDNLSKSMRRLGRIIVDLIPYVYSAPAIVRILGEDNLEKVVKINERYHDGSKPDRLYDVTVGQYDVIVDTGPSYVSRKAESADLLVKLADNNPQMSASFGDLLASYLDAPHEIVERLRKMVPPNLVEKEQPKGPNGLPIPGGNQGPQIPPEIQQMMGKLDALVQAQSKELEDLHKIVDDKNAERQTKLLNTQMEVEGRLKQTQMVHAHEMASEAAGHHMNQVKGDGANTQLIQVINSLAERISRLEGTAPAR